MDLRALRVLICADFFNQPTPPIEIANLLRIDPATVTRAIVTLQTRGLIGRETNPIDHRSNNIVLTKSGKKFADSFRAQTKTAITEAEAHMKIDLSARKRDTILKSLYKLRARSVALSELSKTH